MGHQGKTKHKKDRVLRSSTKVSKTGMFGGASACCGCRCRFCSVECLARTSIQIPQKGGGWSMQMTLKCAFLCTLSSLSVSHPLSLSLSSSLSLSYPSLSYPSLSLSHIPLSLSYPSLSHIPLSLISLSLSYPSLSLISFSLSHIPLSLIALSLSYLSSAPKCHFRRALLQGVPRPGCFKPGCLQFLRGSALSRSSAPFCALSRSFANLRLRSFADLRLRSFAHIRALLRSFVWFCERPRLERLRLGTADFRASYSMCTGESPRNFPSHLHEDDTCAAITRSNKRRFSEKPLGSSLWAMDFLFFLAEGSRRKVTTRRWHLKLVNFTLSGLRFHTLQTRAFSSLALRLSHPCTPQSSPVLARSSPVPRPASPVPRPASPDPF